MQSARQTYRQPQPRVERIFYLIPDPSLARRLMRQLGDFGSELRGGLADYLRAAFLPDRIQEWFPLRLATEIGTAFAHPREFVTGAASTDEIGRKWRKRLIPALATSAAVHGALIVYLIYLALMQAFGNLHVVNKEYRKFDPSILTVHLKYPPQMLKGPQGDKTLTLEEIREKAKKRREEMARERAAREEKEKVEREKAEKERKEAEQKAAELAAKEKPKVNTTEFGEVNEAPIKDMVAEVYALYQAGTLDVNVTSLSVMAAFKIEKDGSLSNIRIIKSSGNKLLDEKAVQLLWMIGESHALGPIADLSSGSIKLDLTENMSRLTVTAFAATPDAAKAKADLLNVLFGIMRMARKKDSPDVAELLSMLKVRSDNKRIDAELAVSRARATEMMNARFGSKPR
ncbi:MAG TPA: energy transducer TonB [Blastocatellia bacterium]|nr:energy transducer TonB [Blastocatellia bacterium]